MKAFQSIKQFKCALAEPNSPAGTLAASALNMNKIDEMINLTASTILFPFFFTFSSKK
jgi:hypothetical protein